MTRFIIARFIATGLIAARFIVIAAKIAACWSAGFRIFIKFAWASLFQGVTCSFKIALCLHA
jgi:hypothetical protein